MFVQHSVHIDRPAAECARALELGPRTWFPNLGGDGRTDVGMRVGGVSAHKKVTVELGAPEKQGDWVSLPISWKATFPEKLFPILTGRLELTPVSKNVTRLTLSGMYEPPLGRLGEFMNEAFMHTVADATVRELAESIARRVGAVVDSGTSTEEGL